MMGIIDIVAMIIFVIGFFGRYALPLHIGGIIMTISTAIEIFIKGRLYNIIFIIGGIIVAIGFGEPFYIGLYWATSPLVLIIGMMLFAPIIRKVFPR